MDWVDTMMQSIMASDYTINEVTINRYKVTKYMYWAHCTLESAYNLFNFAKSNFDKFKGDFEKTYVYDKKKRIYTSFENIDKYNLKDIEIVDLFNVSIPLRFTNNKDKMEIIKKYGYIPENNKKEWFIKNGIL